MTDHHDFGDHHDDYTGGEQHHDEPLNYDDDQQHFDDPGHFGEDQHDAWIPEHVETHDSLPAVDHHETTPTTDDVHIVDDHADTTTTAHDGYDDPADVFPPAVDVGALPEPVDGFPWIDTNALGTPDLGTPDLVAHDGDPHPVDPHELAEYAGTEIPPGADPWTVLAASDDPATSTLARFWHDTGE